MLKLFSSAKEMQCIQSYASMEGQGLFAQAVGNQTRTIVFYAGGKGLLKWKYQNCLFIKSQLHAVILCDDWRSTGAENRFTLVHKVEKDIYTIILN